MNAPNLTKAVCAMLLADWDPIGIRDEPKAQDEYDDYAPAIAQLLRSGADAERIAAHLVHIQTDEMCLPPDQARAQRAAEKLLSLMT
jgi:hypothetical protein